MTGPALRFASDASVCVAGRRRRSTVDGVPRAAVGAGAGAGGRGPRRRRGVRAGPADAIAVAGGLDVHNRTSAARRRSRSAASAATTGRALRRRRRRSSVAGAPTGTRRRRPRSTTPALARRWEIGVHGRAAHGARSSSPAADIDDALRTDCEVHFNSARTGVRLVGPKPRWARPDGGEAGLHPSNIHDNAYAVGAVDFTGDMPILLGPDGPSLGGFVCPVTVASARAVEAGPAAPGRRSGSSRCVRPPRRRWPRSAGSVGRRRRRCSRPAATRTTASLGRTVTADGATAVTYRRSGDDNLLVEYGADASSTSRCGRGCTRCTSALRRSPTARASSTSPRASGRCRCRSTRRVLLARRCSWTCSPSSRHDLPAADELVVPSRTVHLPLSLGRPGDPRGDRALHARRARRRAVVPVEHRVHPAHQRAAPASTTCTGTVFDAEYLVLGLGDVYLGAPVATPLDPRHRLVTTKYNPARTWTPENAVGIGGAYLCIYGMEGPGGYQFVGRTMQVWNRYRRGPHRSSPNSPGCCGSSTASPGTRCRRRSCSTCAPTWPPDGANVEIERRRRSPSPSTSGSSPRTPTTSRRSGPQWSRRAPRSGRAGPQRASSPRGRRPHEKPYVKPPRVERGLVGVRGGCRGCRRGCPASSAR